MDIANWHPDRVIERLVRRLPQSWQEWIAAIVVVLSWYGLINSSLSVLSDLRWVVDAAKWLLAHAGALQQVLLYIGAAIHIVVELWRQVTAPAFELLFGWLFRMLSFEAPGWVFDLVVIGMVYLGARVRSTLLVWSNRSSIFADHAKQLATIERNLHDLLARVKQLTSAVATARNLGPRLLAEISSMKAEIAKNFGQPNSRAQRAHLEARIEQSTREIANAQAQVDRDTQEINELNRRAVQLERQIEAHKAAMPERWLSVLSSARKMRTRALLVSAFLFACLLADTVYLLVTEIA